jgi:DNA polymerase III epsilon subunit family exonuclease
MTSRFAVIDFETTGLSPDNGDRITEVAIVIVESEKIVDQFESLVNTGRSIPYEVQNLTGITNQMTANAPSASLIIPQVHQYVKNSTLIAHNASFDSKFFHSEMSIVGIKTNVDFICTLLLSRRLYPTLDNHKLGTLAKYHGIKSQGKSHRALADALVTAELFIQISNDLKDYLSTENLTAHQYLRSQKQPLNSFLRSSKISNVSISKQQSSVTKSFIKQAPQASAQVQKPTDLIVNTPLIKLPVDIPKEIKNIDSDFEHHGIKLWIKTPTGLKNKKTSLFISYADTLRDVFPVPGYQVKGNHPFSFIKDSDIDSEPTITINQSSKVPSNAMQKLRNLFQSNTNSQSKNQSKPLIDIASPPINGFGHKTFSSGDHYEGMFSNGKLHGHGKYTWKNGSTYEGNWVEGEMTGGGKSLSADGTIKSGNFLKGQLHGQGTLIFSPSGEWKGDRYVGEFINGIREGLGTYTWSNGTTYSGQWIASKMFGNGIMKTANGVIETGNFKDGLLNGFGTRRWKSEEGQGDHEYEGHFQNGKRHGRGIQKFANGDCYDGDWIEDIRNGHGVYTWANGNQYKGGWVNGRMSNQGLLTWPNGDSHDGMFANGLRHGKGSYKTANGEEYSGIWLAGELDQECKWCDAYGNVYEGELKNFEFHGDGTLTWSNGAKYEGGYLDGLRHGKGTFTTKNKAEYSGHWKEGILIDTYAEWIENQAAKFSSRYKKLIKMKQICIAHSEKWIPLNSNHKQNSKPEEEYEDACQSLVEKLDILLADYDAFYEEFFIDINDCYFCCFEEDYEDQILNRFEQSIDHITILRNELYKIYLSLI